MNVSSAVRTAVAGWIATMLASLTIFPLVQGQSWYLALGFLAALVAATGLVVRRFTASAGVVVAAQVVVWVLAICAIFLPEAAFLGLLPGPDAVAAARDLLSQGLVVMHRASPPVPDTPGVVFVTTAGLGLVALCVDVIAVTLRRPAVAGLPLLATYCVPAAVLADGLDWTFFLLAAAGFLVLVGVDSVDRVQAWGRVLGGSGSPGRSASSSSPWSTGLDGARGIAAASLAAAILLPVIVPGIGERALTGSGGSGTGPGRGAVTVINPLLQLRKDLGDQSNAPIITYRTSDPNPQPLRIVVDDVFTGDTWEPAQGDYQRSQSVRNDAPLAPGLSSGTPIEPLHVTINVGSLGQHYLPVPYPWQSVDVPGNWYYDETTRNIVGDGVTAKDLRYTVQAYRVKPTPAELDLASSPPSSLSGDLVLPADLDPEVKKITLQHAGSGSLYDQMTHLRDWLRTFTYSTQAPGDGQSDAGVDAVLAFLHRKSGYCVHFASAMAVMARLLGVPARVAVGFLPGTRNADGTWTVRLTDAHAWPELYFQGVGWVRFEPTPPARTAGVGDVVGGDPTQAPNSSIAPSVSGATPSASKDPKLGRESQANADAAGSTAQPSLWRRVLAAVPWPWFAAVLVVLLLAATPAAAAAFVRRRRWGRATTRTARAEAALEELSDRLGDLGVPVAPSLTPRALRQWLVGAEYVPPAAVAPLDRLVAEVEAARYAPPGGTGAEPARLRADAREVAAVVADQLPARRRRLARFFPATGIALVTGAARTTDGVSSGSGFNGGSGLNGGSGFNGSSGSGRKGADTVGDEPRKLTSNGRRR